MAASAEKIYTVTASVGLPAPITQATMLKRTHEIQCGKCAISDYAENIGVWNDDGTLQELGLCGECEEEDMSLCVNLSGTKEDAWKVLEEYERQLQQACAAAEQMDKVVKDIERP